MALAPVLGLTSAQRQTISGEIRMHRYRIGALASFIPDQYIDAPLACAKFNQTAYQYKYFGGDNRSFLDHGYMFEYWNPGTATSRVAASVSSLWTTNLNEDPNQWSSMLKHHPYTGWSNGYDQNHNLVASSKASTDEITLEEAASEAVRGTAYRRVKADSALPLCDIAPAISWEHEYYGYRSGWISVTGEFDQAPSTEILWEAADVSSTYIDSGCWFRFENRGCEYLAAPWPNATVDLDANPEVAVPSCPVDEA